jgi:hypothetical protein
MLPSKPSESLSPSLENTSLSAELMLRISELANAIIKEFEAHPEKESAFVRELSEMVHTKILNNPLAFKVLLDKLYTQKKEQFAGLDDTTRLSTLENFSEFITNLTLQHVDIMQNPEFDSLIREAARKHMDNLLQLHQAVTDKARTILPPKS